MPAEDILTIDDIREQAWEVFMEYSRLRDEMYIVNKFEAMTPDEFASEYIAALGRALAAAFEEEFLYFFPPPPAQPKPEETPVPQRFTEKCSKCGMYFQYQKGDKAIHKACKK